ncbi:MAG: serine--tRNA ligase, partial [Deltaproteobacteria bacterium]|nr:serine--tRNA ligase [Candidatus Tharpella sp.]
MLDLKFIRNNLEAVATMLKARCNDLDLSEFKLLDRQRLTLLGQVETLKNQRNTCSDAIAKMKKAKADAGAEIAAMRDVSRNIKELDAQVAEVENELYKIVYLIPNITHTSVPLGNNEENNSLVREWGLKPELSFPPLPHWEIGEKLKILDFERGAKITGARFTLYRDLGAKLERALINFMLDLHTDKHGYTEVLPPFIVNEASMTGTGQLPKFADDLFKLEGLDYYLIPTAEVPVTNIFRNEILEDSELPSYFVAYTPCFRKEAGSHGRDTRGLIRQHQFNKVELVKFADPENSYEELEKLLTNAESILQALNLHYRVVNLCSGDLGFSASKTYDIEVWLPGQGVYREISSCSNFEDFQARRANIRYRPKTGGKTRFIHTLNGSGLAVGRTVVAILENYQQEDGSVIIPEVLRPYLGGRKRISQQ